MLIQLDVDSRTLRCRPDENGAMVAKGTGQFYVPKKDGEAILTEVGLERIHLKESEDGWWYGNY